VLLLAAAALVAGAFVWSSLTAGGVPDPTDPGTSSTVAIGILVFREGLECILVLAAITAGLAGMSPRPITAGAGLGFLATVATWFVAVGIIDDLSESLPALDLQVVTGLLAILVLLLVMNWFFHKVYWTGWISMHNRRKQLLLKGARGAELSRRRLLWGLGLLGFTSFYREGFEVVLFLQSYRLKLGGQPVFNGVAIGLFLSAIVAVLTFVAHRKLPYRRMLVATGVMLGIVLLVMVGEQAQEMQLAHWLPTTRIEWLAGAIPDWMGLWFAVFPTVETLVAQAIAAVLVLGSYFVAREKRPRTESDSEQRRSTSPASADQFA
jgi:high-affinity iron transporter